MKGEETVVEELKHEKRVNEMHAEFGRRRKITLSGLPIDSNEEVRESVCVCVCVCVCAVYVCEEERWATQSGTCCGVLKEYLLQCACTKTDTVSRSIQYVH